MIPNKQIYEFLRPTIKLALLDNPNNIFNNTKVKHINELLDHIILTIDENNHELEMLEGYGYNTCPACKEIPVNWFIEMNDDDSNTKRRDLRCPYCGATWKNEEEFKASVERHKQ